MNKWTEYLSKALSAIPYLLAAINVIHAEKDSASKVQIAQDTLAVVTAGAKQELPDHAPTAQAVSDAISAALSATQAIHDAA